MKQNGVSKYIPITEEEYEQFRQLKNKQAKLTQEELARPSAVHPLATAQNEKAHVLFTPTNDSEAQEQRFVQLSNIIRDLKSQLEERKAPPVQQPKPSFGNISSTNVQKKAMALLEALGDGVWNSSNELVIDGNAIPNSNMEELMNFVTSNWRTKYQDKAPTGSSDLMNLIKAKNVPESLLGEQVRAQLKPQVKGLAVLSKRQNVKNLRAKKRELKEGFVTERKKLKGEQVLSSAKLFKHLMDT